MVEERKMTDGDRPLDMQIGERCDVCLRYYRMNYIVPHDVWKQISPIGKKEGYLCPECADNRARAIGIHLTFRAVRHCPDLTAKEMAAAIVHYHKTREGE